jgi:hypothetical protein
MNYNPEQIFNGRIFETIPLIMNYLKKEGEKSDLTKIKRSKVDILDEFNTLNGVEVTGVDGSQINHLKEFGIPFGAVQVAKIKIVHGKGDYEIGFKSKWVGMNEDIPFERFKLEIISIMEEIEKGGRNHYIFYDGSLVLSFTNQLRRDLRESYIELVNELLEKSNEMKVPLFAFIERSFAKDISKGVYHDSYTLSEVLERLEYTEPIVCKRDIALEYKNPIYFSYLRIYKNPVRVEFPEWMTDDFEKHIEIACAECLLGSTKNYPYILERAHKYAHIGEKERNTIGLYLCLGLEDSISQKWISKII